MISQFILRRRCECDVGISLYDINTHQTTTQVPIYDVVPASYVSGNCSTANRDCKAYCIKQGDDMDSRRAVVIRPPICMQAA